MFGYKSQPVVVFDIPREDVETVHYSTIEALKNGITFSRKYASEMHIFEPPKIVVMMNKAPDLTKLSADRYIVKRTEELDQQYKQRIQNRQRRLQDRRQIPEPYTQDCTQSTLEEDLDS